MNSKHRLSGATVAVGVLLAVACILLCGGMGACAQTDNRISLDVVDADLQKVVMLLARESNQSIIIADQDKTHAKVTATLKDMPLETALKRVVESVGCTWRRESDGTYIIGGQAAAPVAPVNDTLTVPTADMMNSYSRAMDEGSIMKRETRVESIKLYNIRPVDMMWLLGLYNPEDAITIADTGQARGVKIPGVVPLPQLDNTPPTADSLKRDSNAVERARNLTEELAQAMPPMPGGPRQTGRPGNLGGPANQGGPNQGTGNQQSGLWPEGVDYIMPYELDNSLIVKGTDDGIRDLQEMIKQLDLPPKQVSIKAEFVEISTSEESTLGIDWNLQSMGTTFETQFGPGGNVVFGYANGNVMATLRAKLFNHKAKLINAPIISTLNNVMATIQVGKVVPYWTTIVVPNGTNGYITQQVPQFLPIRSQLLVRPTINRGDNSITVFMQPVISDAGSPVTGPDGTAIPTQNEQSLSTTRRVQNGETIVVGGIIRKSDSTDVNKIPLLGDLPIVGPLFRSTTKTAADTELLIFLTPTIVPERPVAGAGVGIMAP